MQWDLHILQRVSPSMLTNIVAAYNAIINCPETLEYLHQLYMFSLNSGFGIRKISSASFRKLSDQNKKKCLIQIDKAAITSKGMFLIVGRQRTRSLAPVISPPLLLLQRLLLLGQIFVKRDSSICTICNLSWCVQKWKRMKTI